MARTPRNGFCSGASRRYGIALSPPMSASRMTTGRSGPNASRTRRYASTCSVSVGGVCRLMNRNSVRKSPTPSARAASARGASSGVPMFATRRMRSPSAVAAGRSRSPAAVARRVARSASRSRYSVASREPGSTTTSPRSPSMAIVTGDADSAARPSTAAIRPSMPTMAGMPRLRARITAWAVREPPASAIPSRKPGGISAVTDGGRSSQTAIEGTAGRSRTSPRRTRQMRAPTSRTSAARADRISSSSEARSSAAAAAAARTASAGSPVSPARRIASSTSPGSRAIIDCASKMADSCSRPRSRRRPASESSWRAVSAAAASIASAGRWPDSGRLAAAPGAGSAASNRHTGPMAMPGAPATPVRRTGPVTPRAPPPGRWRTGRGGR